MRQHKSSNQAVLQNSTVFKGYCSKTHQKNGVKPSPYSQAVVEPLPTNSGILLDDYGNATAITNWPDEIERRIARFGPITKRLGANCAR